MKYRDGFKEGESSYAYVQQEHVRFVSVLFSTWNGVTCWLTEGFMWCRMGLCSRMRWEMSRLRVTRSWRLGIRSSSRVRVYIPSTPLFSSLMLTVTNFCFATPAYIADSTPTVTLEEAISTAEALLEGTRLPSSDAAPKLEYVVLEDGSVILAHVVQIRNEDRTTWWQAYVNAHSGEVKSVVDFVAHATVRFRF